MKFADLITRLENVTLILFLNHLTSLIINLFQKYLKEKPARLNNDMQLIVDDLHMKYSEYKRIKKPVFRRQVEKAHEIVTSKNDFITELEIKLEKYKNFY